MPTTQELDTELAAFSQQTLDTLAEHSVRIDAAQADADTAQVSANAALTQILQTGLAATLYTDAEIERIRQSLQNQITAFTGNVNQTIANEVQTQVTLYEPTLRAALNSAITDTRAIADALGLDFVNFNAITDQLLNTDLPNLNNTITVIGNAQQTTANQVAVALAGLQYSSVAGGIDAAVQTAVELAQAFGHTVLAAPAALWTTTSTSVLLGTKVPPLEADFYTDDPSFGNVYEFPDGVQTIGPMASLPHDTSRVYRMMARFRVISDGTSGGVDVAAGAMAWAPGSAWTSPVQRYTVADGDVQFYAYATGSPTMLTRLADKIAVDLTGSGFATQIFPYVEQNSGGLTDGKIRLSMFEIIDVTDAFEAQAAFLDNIDATPPLVPVGLVVTSRNIDGVRYRMTATWDLATEDGVVGYDVAVAQGAGNEVVFPVASNQWEADVAPGETYTVRVRSRDRFVNDSVYSAVVSHTVSGEAIISEDNLDDISASKIVVSGETRLSDWRTGGDETKINGGAISANTIAANKLTIGSRGLVVNGITFEAGIVNEVAPFIDEISWSAGTIRYTDDAGSTAVANIVAGTDVYEGGTLFVYWEKGSGVLAATTLAFTAFSTNNVILAAYTGTGNITTNYGRTIIDGNTIRTGTIFGRHLNIDAIEAITIDASQIVSGSISTSLLNVNNLLQFGDGGAFAVNKDSAADPGNGLYFGNPSGTSEFSFYATTKAGTTDIQEITVDESKIELLNPIVNFGTKGGTVTGYSVGDTLPHTQQVADNFETIDLVLVAGGGGGGASEVNGNAETGVDGGDTVVEIGGYGPLGAAGGWITQTFTLLGGKGGPSGKSSVSSVGFDHNGERGPYGNGGIGGFGYDYTTQSGNGFWKSSSGGDATGFGAGGGGGGLAANSAEEGDGGKAGEVLVLKDWSFAEAGIFSAKYVTITSVGTGGAGASGPTSGGNGTDGFVSVRPVENQVENFRFQDVSSNEWELISEFADGVPTNGTLNGWFTVWEPIWDEVALQMDNISMNADGYWYFRVGAFGGSELFGSGTGMTPVSYNAGGSDSNTTSLRLRAQAQTNTSDNIDANKVFNGAVIIGNLRNKSMQKTIRGRYEYMDTTLTQQSRDVVGGAIVSAVADQYDTLDSLQVQHTAGFFTGVGNMRLYGRRRQNGDDPILPYTG